jgi:hypothetical protein
MIELCGPNLKAKYLKPKPKGHNKANYSGNSGTRHHGKVPHGLRAKVKPGRKRY